MTFKAQDQGILTGSFKDKCADETRADEVACSPALPKLLPILIRTKGLGWWRRITVGLKRREWIVVDDYYYRWNDRYDVVIPDGFTFDGASLPRILWSILSPTGILFLPGLVHDYAYRNRYIWCYDRYKDAFFKKPYDREMADRAFLHIGQQVNGFVIVNRIAWIALKLFGRSAWRSGPTRAQDLEPKEYYKPTNFKGATNDSRKINTDRS